MATVGSRGQLQGLSSAVVLSWVRLRYNFEMRTIGLAGFSSLVALECLDNKVVRCLGVSTG
jgi:hypothetical protein